MDNKKLLGKRIKELRKRSGLSQEKLAELTFVEPTSISNIENGRNFPSFITLERIINTLNVSFIDVFSYSHHNKPENLLKEIKFMLEKNPSKIQDAYKIVKALVE